MPICLNGHARYQDGCAHCESGNFKSEGPASDGAIGPWLQRSRPSDPNQPVCPQCDFDADSWHSIYDHMIEKHPGVAISARIYEKLTEMSVGSVLNEDDFPSTESSLAQVNKSPTITVRHGFVPTRNDRQSCNICSGVPGDPIHLVRAESLRQIGQDSHEAGQTESKPNRDWSSRRHFQGMSARELESERQRALRKTKTGGAKKWVFLIVAVGGIVGAVLAVGYFLPDKAIEGIISTDIPDGPKSPIGSNAENPAPDSGAVSAPAVTSNSTPVPSTSTAALKPTPTLTLNELFQLNDSGVLSDEETIQELDRRDSEIAYPSSTKAAPTEADETPTVRGLEKGTTEWINALESEIHRLVNVERRQNSLSELSKDPALDEVARGHSVDMALNDYFEHENLAGQDATDRGNEAGYTCRKDFGSFYTIGLGENIFKAWLYSSYTSRSRNYMTMEALAFQVVDGWMKSPGHRENILTDTYDREGIGVSIGAEESVWVTQNFC